MDVLNHLFSRLGLITKIDIQAIGRMSAGWARGRFRYRHPGELATVKNESLLGYLTHHAIGIGLAIPFVAGWELLVGGPLSPMWTLVFGIATTFASVLFVYPSLGLGVFIILSKGHGFLSLEDTNDSWKINYADRVGARIERHGCVQ